MVDFDADSVTSFRKYEEFVDIVLQKDLEAATDAMDETYTRYAEAKRLRQNLKVIQASKVRGFSSLVNLGCDVFSESEVPDSTAVYVDTAFGFYVRLSLEEAVAFLEKKEAFLHRRLVYWREKCAYLKSQMRLFTEALATVLQTGQVVAR